MPRWRKGFWEWHETLQNRSPGVHLKASDEVHPASLIRPDPLLQTQFLGTALLSSPSSCSWCNHCAWCVGEVTPKWARAGAGQRQAKCCWRDYIHGWENLTLFCWKPFKGSLILQIREGPLFEFTKVGSGWQNWDRHSGSPDPFKFKLPCARLSQPALPHVWV